jgi:acyl CoA:acetate/3-ketoacid CoA transferase beta subunit
MALTREQMAQRVARELKDGYYVNLGIGIPTLVANYVPEGIDVMLAFPCPPFNTSTLRPSPPKPTN